MSARWPGGVIRNTPVAPSGGTASGVWTMADASYWKKQGLWPTSPQAPTIGTATAGTNLCASVSFTAPTCKGTPSSICSYTVTSSPGCITKIGFSSPITVTGLTNNTTYTFKVKATNPAGVSPCSASSNSITVSKTCATYTAPGTYTWVAPTGVTSIAVVAIGGGAGGTQATCCGGGGGGGGALAYRNGYAVTPGNSYTVVVGNGSYNGGTAGASRLHVCCSNIVAAGGANSSIAGFVITGTGYQGGYGGGPAYSGGGGGGAGGYSNTGGSGAGGSGGNGAQGVYRYLGGPFPNAYSGGGGGGGVGIYGEGSSGAAGGTNSCTAFGGGGGSGGGTGAATSVGSFGSPGGTGGGYGGGGGGGGVTYNNCYNSYYPGGPSSGNVGAVRIVWAGGSRGTPSFPSTNVGP